MLLVLLGQAALAQEVGGRQLIIDQPRYLLDWLHALTSNCALSLTGEPGHPGLEGEFALVEAHRIMAGNGSSARRTPASLESIVFVGNRRTVLNLHDDEDVDAYRRAAGRITEVSLPATNPPRSSPN